MVYLKIREIVLNRLSEKKKVNPSYSLRALSRDVGIDQSLFIKIINGKRRPSARSIERIAQAFNLSESQIQEISGSSPS